MNPGEGQLPISALQHLLFCERQCALIHVEGLWVENRLTAEGRLLHERPDQGERSTRSELRTESDVPVSSEQLGLYGRADVVEFARGLDGSFVAFPVEYKRGRRAPRAADEVQLCAQGICLEEMLGSIVSAGAIYHHATRRRRRVEFDVALRELTWASVVRLRRLIESGITPRGEPGAKCRSCSLVDLCQPGPTSQPDRASAYVARLASGEP